MERIIFFARTPAPGVGKSRLRKDIPNEAVDALVRALYEDLFSTLLRAERPVVIYYEGLPPERGVPAIAQRGDDLGERMARAISSELEKGPSILLGSDLVGIDENYIRDAFSALRKSDLVLGPSLDGGYGLIGMNHFFDVFSNISYSRSDVLENTLQKARDLDKSVSLLPPVRDIDTLKDLAENALQSPVLESVEDDKKIRFYAKNGAALHLFFKKPTDPLPDLRAPETFMPFYHILQIRKEPYETE